jgi:hypothetical protein
LSNNCLNNNIILLIFVSFRVESSPKNSLFFYCFFVRVSLDNIHATHTSTKRVIDFYISDLFILEIAIFFTKFLAVGGLVRIIIRYSNKDRGRDLNKNTDRIITGIISIYIYHKNNKSFVCLISYFLVIYTSAEIVLGLVKTLKTNN